MKSIASLIEEANEEFCNYYCKWPDQYDMEENDGIELCDSEHCANCPLNWTYERSANNGNME